MSSLSPWASVLALVLSLRFDLPIVMPGAKPAPPSPARTVEDLIASREWIAASRMHFSDGGLDLGIFAEKDVDAVRMQLRNAIPPRSAAPGVVMIPRSGCTTSLEVNDHFLGGLTLDDMLSTSPGIYSGTILSEEPGIMRGLPAVLMRLRIESVLRGAADHLGDHLDLFYPHAQFIVDGHKFCGIDANGGFDPKVGDRLLVFAAQPFPARGTPALVPAPEQVAVESADGKLFLPKALRLDRRLYAVESLSEMETVLRHALTAQKTDQR
jgi:hypothetical protein